MSNVEGMNSVYFRKTERSETILRNSAVHMFQRCVVISNTIAASNPLNYFIALLIFESLLCILSSINLALNSSIPPSHE